MVIPDDSSTISYIADESLQASAYVDHGLLPFSIRVGFRGADEGLAFFFVEGVVDDDGV